MIRARLTCSGSRPPQISFGSQTTMSSSGTPILYAVLRPRCWSGRNSTFSPRAHAHLSVAAAFDEVQTTPPRSPQNAFIDAAELIYVTGMTEARGWGPEAEDGTWASASAEAFAMTPISVKSRQQFSNCSGSAMSDIEQPAARSGRMTC